MSAVRPTPNPQTPKPGLTGVVTPHPPAWHQRLAASLIYLLVRTVSLTIRYRMRDDAGVLEGDGTEPVVFCIWHNRLALCLENYRLYTQRVGRQRRMAAMVSASKDGGLLARILEHYNVQPVRGSTSRRGRQALLELTTWAERGYDLAITPDGPRGPRYVVQDGVTSLAQVTGLRIVAVTCKLTWKLQLRSWDRFQIPLPFSQCVTHFAGSVRVPRDASDQEREQTRRRLEELLKQATVD